METRLVYGSEAMAKRQNTSHAVMAQRTEAADSLDDFPTPPWATRALLEHVIGKRQLLNQMSCLEPACGSGHMAKVLAEYFGAVHASDIHDYGYGLVADYLAPPPALSLGKRGSKKRIAPAPMEVDWVITNPPFRLAEDFLETALKQARVGVALLTRTVFIESVGRYERIFKPNPPSHFAQFTERVPMVKGRLDKKASTATGYSWLVWEKSAKRRAQLVWVPPCRKSLERDGDYGPAPALTRSRPEATVIHDTDQTDLFAA